LKRDSKAYNDVLLPWYQCSRNPECIAPAGSSLSNHRFDQSVMSYFALKESKYQCINDERYFADFRTDQRMGDSIVFFSRRWHCPKPYSRFLRTATISTNPPLKEEDAVTFTGEREAYPCGTLTWSPSIDIPIVYIRFLVTCIHILVTFVVIYLALKLNRRRKILFVQTPRDE
jgi:hypothetical protein